MRKCVKILALTALVILCIAIDINGGRAHAADRVQITPALSGRYGEKVMSEQEKHDETPDDLQQSGGETAGGGSGSVGSDTVEEFQAWWDACPSTKPIEDKIEADHNITVDINDTQIETDAHQSGVETGQIPKEIYENKQEINDISDTQFCIHCETDPVVNNLSEIHENVDPKLSPSPIQINIQNSPAKIPTGEHQAIVAAVHDIRTGEIPYIEIIFRLLHKDFLNVEILTHYKYEFRIVDENMIQTWGKCGIDLKKCETFDEIADQLIGTGVDIRITDTKFGDPQIEVLRLNLKKKRRFLDLFCKQFHVPDSLRQLIFDARYQGGISDFVFGVMMVSVSNGASFNTVRYVFENSGIEKQFLNIFKGYFITADVRRQNYEEALALMYHTVTGHGPAQIDDTPNAKIILFSRSGEGCKQFINKVRTTRRAKYDPVMNWDFAGEVTCSWVQMMGGLFFINQDDELMMQFQGRVYRVSADRKNRSFLALFKKITGTSPLMSPGPVLFEGFANLAYERSCHIKIHPWVYGDVDNHAVYVNLHNKRNELLRIAWDGISVLPNGINEYGILLDKSDEVEPIEFLPDTTVAESMEVAQRLIIDNLACRDEQRWAYFHWQECSFLKDFVFTAPHARNYGPSGSAKTTAADMMSTQVYGNPMHINSTVAALYAEAGKNPVIFPDNREGNNVNQDEIDCYLQLATGGISKKRRAGSGDKNVSQSMRAFVNSTGIEDISNGYSELSSRMLSFQFDLNHSTAELFSHIDSIQAIQAERDVILTGVFKKLSIVLLLLKHDARLDVMRTIQNMFGDHAKKRMNDALALMFLCSIVDDTTSMPELQARTQELTPAFKEFIMGQQELSDDTAVEINPIVDGLMRIFYEYQIALAQDAEADSTTKMDAFLRKYQIPFSDVNTIKKVKAGQLHAALAKACKSYRYDNPLQLSRRIDNDLKTLERGGFTLEKSRGAARYVLYTISINDALLAECPKVLGVPAATEAVAVPIEGDERDGQDPA